MGHRFIEIHYDVLAKLLEWNSAPNNDYRDFDFPFALSVFLCVVPSEQVKLGKLDPEIEKDAYGFLVGELF